MGTGDFRTGAHNTFPPGFGGPVVNLCRGDLSRPYRRSASASWASSSHEMPWNIFCNPALVICNPSFRDFLGGEARHHRGGTSRHDNLNSIGRVFLGYDPVGGVSMRMFFCHSSNMAKESRKCTPFRVAKCSTPRRTPLPDSGDELLNPEAHFPPVHFRRALPLFIKPVYQVFAEEGLV